MHTNCSRTLTAYYFYNNALSPFLPDPKDTGILALTENLQIYFTINEIFGVVTIFKNSCCWE
jgi:hypothetical protein